jgi:hypothetical protein
MDESNTELSWEELWSLSASLPKDAFGPLLTRYQEQERRKQKPGPGSGVWDQEKVKQKGKPMGMEFMEVNNFPIDLGLESKKPSEARLDPFIGRNDNLLEKLLDEYLMGLDKIEEVE